MINEITFNLRIIFKSGIEVTEKEHEQFADKRVAWGSE